MADPFVAEIRIFAGNFAPRGWSFCNGQLLPISQNTALFSLIGTTFGGDGRTTTGLPDLKGRAPMHPGRGPGLTARRLGQKLGGETVTLSLQQMANHTHNVNASAGNSNSNDPTGRYLGRPFGGGNLYGAAENLVPMSTKAIPDSTGGGQAHNNLQPFNTLNFIIALQGVYPSRS
jgi:microcystin-dependent protein